MPLTFTGKTGASEQFEMLLEAYDGTSRIVGVTSSEAIDDHGLAKVQRVASDKYDGKKFDGNGHVKVLTSDFSPI